MPRLAHGIVLAMPNTLGFLRINRVWLPILRMGPKKLGSGLPNRTALGDNESPVLPVH